MGATGCIIAIDKYVNIYMNFTTDAMKRAFCTSEGNRKFLSGGSDFVLTNNFLRNLSLLF